MKAFSADDAKNWCEEHRVIFPERLSWNGQFRPTALEESQSIRFDIRKDSGGRINDCRSLFEPLGNQTILVWYDDWGVWPSCEWTPMFDRFRQAFGVIDPLIERPAYLFDSSEFDDALSFFIFAALFLWDCHVITEQQGYCIFISHDEYGFSKFPKGKFK